MFNEGENFIQEMIENIGKIIQSRATTQVLLKNRNE